jgi:hypothetical protein
MGYLLLHEGHQFATQQWKYDTKCRSACPFLFTSLFDKASLRAVHNMMILSAVSTVRGGAPMRIGKAHGRQSVRALSASSSGKPGQDSTSTPPASDASDITVDATPETPDESWKKPLSAAQIFGSYLQVGLWVVVLSVAGFSGFQQVRFPLWS